MKLEEKKKKKTKYDKVKTKNKPNWKDTFH